MFSHLEDHKTLEGLGALEILEVLENHRTR